MRYIVLCAFLLILAGCNQKASTQKLGANDPFKSTMVPSEFFTIIADKDNVVEGANGTTIAMPKGCFKDSKGNIINGEVKVELAEALSLDKMLASNLTTLSDGNPLETDGMIYFNAKSDGKEVAVNKDKPVYIEIPSKHKRPGMKVYRGVRDANGNMNWVDPKPTAVFLRHVDIDKLDFLPDGFAAQVTRAMPFGGQKKASKSFIDSLYYSFSTFGADQSALMQQQQVKGSLLNEPHDNPNKKIVNGAYTKESYSPPHSDSLSDTNANNDRFSHGLEIDPVRVRSIKDVRFNNTLIATKEFERRLKYIFKTCSKDVLEIYLKNLDKNMWELDEMAAEKLGADPLADRFRKFAAQKLTNVKDAPEQASIMTQYYDQQLAKNKEELTKVYVQAVSSLQAQQKVVDSMSEAYTRLLWKREKYRMERYGFTWTDAGWINIDTGWAPKLDPALPQKLEVKVSNADKYDRVHVYVVFEYMKSLYKLNAESNSIHYAGNSTDRCINMQLRKKAKIIAVAYIDSVPYLGVKDFITGSATLVNLGVLKSSQVDIGRTMNEIENGDFMAKNDKGKEASNADSGQSGYLEENSLEVDLSFQNFFYQEENRQDQLAHDRMILDHLYNIVYPCRCSDVGIGGGRLLFRSNCSSCHSTNIAQTGPALNGVTERHTREWLYQFTRNWKDMVARGDKDAIVIQNYSPSEMNTFPSLKDEDLKKIYDYIECESNLVRSISK